MALVALNVLDVLVLVFVLVLLLVATLSADSSVIFGCLGLMALVSQRHSGRDSRHVETKLAHMLPHACSYDGIPEHKTPPVGKTC